MSSSKEVFSYISWNPEGRDRTKLVTLTPLHVSDLPMLSIHTTFTFAFIVNEMFPLSRIELHILQLSFLLYPVILKAIGQNHTFFLILIKKKE